ncbi:rRNA guanine-N2-methyltransferase [Nitzschia inconspicua]|uniref:rRNA guanine-N2-methyltransferase n=1 Tax=Nitzschia inconspicua TaxID=303405 RepID=A0A9K3LJF4_9STRA|nr:rRNA guanine-N2-methyltransferase [Nitzschia inconspicua]
MTLGGSYWKAVTLSLSRKWQNSLTVLVPVVERRALSTTIHDRVINGQIEVTCQPGLEDVLSTELKALGLDPGKLSKNGKRGRLILQSKQITDTDLFRCCLYLGSAANIRWKCTSFSARGLAELRRKTAKVDWTEYIKMPMLTEDSGHNPMSGIDVRVSATKSKLYHSEAVRERILLGISDSFGNTDLESKSLIGRLKDSEENPEPSNTCTLLLTAKIERDQVDIFVNAYPTPLHQRGYRLQTGKAPLREDLAYAMLFSAGWIPAWIKNGSTEGRSKYPGLLDPFCGSGTIIIEGLGMALGLLPGRLRASPFQNTTIDNPDLWKSLQTNSVAASKPSRVRVSASDRDAGAVKATEDNAKRANVWKFLDGHLHHVSLSGQPWFLKDLRQCPSSVLVVTNPPFGNRISRKSHLLPLHQKLGHSMQQLVERHQRTVRGVILTDDPIFLSKVGHGSRMQSKTLLSMSHGGGKVFAIDWAPKSK